MTRASCNYESVRVESELRKSVKAVIREVQKLRLGTVQEPKGKGVSAIGRH
jgi:hypothetical protein